MTSTMEKLVGHHRVDKTEHRTHTPVVVVVRTIIVKLREREGQRVDLGRSLNSHL